jgi:hypothetical protein
MRRVREKVGAAGVSSLGVDLEGCVFPQAHPFSFEEGSMNIIREYPPNINEIRKSFPVKGKSVIFAWGEDIYNPNGVQIPKHLIAHEAVHMARQRAFVINLHGAIWEGITDASREKGVWDWWNCYINDIKFRFDEELPAHQAEYLWFLQNGAHRPERRRAISEISRRLAGPLYGRLISKSAAKEMLEMCHKWRDHVIPKEDA